MHDLLIASASIMFGQGISAWIRIWQHEYRNGKRVWRWVWRRR